MKAVTHYEVNGHLFANKEQAQAVEEILTNSPDLKFDVDGNSISLKVKTYEGSAKIEVTENEVKIVFVTHDPSTDTAEIMDLERRGILWDFSRGTQTFTPKNKKNLLEDFKLLYEYTKEVRSLI